MLATLAIVIAGAAIPTTAVPQPESDLSRAATVEGVCKAGNVSLEVACDTYLRGMYEGLLAGQLSASEVTSFCPPPDPLGTADIRRAFLSYMAAAPGSSGDEAGLVLLNALEDAYPCPVDEGPSFPGPLDFLDGTA